MKNIKQILNDIMLLFIGFSVMHNVILRMDTTTSMKPKHKLLDLALAFVCFTGFVIFIWSLL